MIPFRQIPPQLLHHGQGHDRQITGTEVAADKCRHLGTKAALPLHTLFIGQQSRGAGMQTILHRASFRLEISTPSHHAAPQDAACRPERSGQLPPGGLMHRHQDRSGLCPPPHSWGSVGGGEAPMREKGP